MTIEKNHEGAWLISDIWEGLYVSRLYYFYTKREAIRQFKAEFPQR